MLIGIVGFAGSGKDSIGNYFTANHNFVADSFSKSVKDAAACIFGWDREMLEGATPESRFWRKQRDRFWAETLDIKGFTPRMALQMLGTESGRNVFGVNLWTSTVINRYNQAGQPNTVITDCRFPNEIDLIRNRGGLVIRCRRGPEPEWYSLMVMYNKGWCDEKDERKIKTMRATGIMPHESETAWIGCDVDDLIENDAELEDLEKSVLDLSTKHSISYAQYGLGV